MICKSSEETLALGRRLGALLKAGDVVALRGRLGMGKTQLVRGIAETYLGEGGHVCSPSFTIINRYEVVGKRIYHLDLYRLSTLEDLESTGYWETVEDPTALVLIEWLEQVDRAQPLEFVTIDIEFESDAEDLNDMPRVFDLLPTERAFELYERLSKAFKCVD